MSISIGFVLFSPVPEMDFIGPLEVFRAANFLLKPPDQYGIDIFSASFKSKSAVGASGLKLTLNQNLKFLKRLPHTLIVAGGPEPMHPDHKNGVEWLFGVA